MEHETDGQTEIDQGIRVEDAFGNWAWFGVAQFSAFGKIVKQMVNEQRTGNGMGTGWGTKHGKTCFKEEAIGAAHTAITCTNAKHRRSVLKSNGVAVTCRTQQRQHRLPKHPRRMMRDTGTRHPSGMKGTLTEIRSANVSIYDDEVGGFWRRTKSRQKNYKCSGHKMGLTLGQHSPPRAATSWR